MLTGNLAYLTSCRELSNSESAGRLIVDPATSRQLGYRMSLLESLCRALSLGHDATLGDLRLCCVLSDDDDLEIKALKDQGFPWPAGLTVPRHSLSDDTVRVEDLTRSVSSLALRTLGQRKASLADREVEKRRFEEKLLHTLAEAETDLLVCDSYMLLLTEWFLTNFRGRIVNMHPGITDHRDQGWLPGATPTRDAVTRAKFGFVITDDKRAVPHPAGRATTVHHQDRIRSAIEVGIIGRSGVTCHKITAQVDGGPILAEAIYNFDPAAATEEQVRSWNYALKLPVLLAGLRVLA